MKRFLMSFLFFFSFSFGGPVFSQEDPEDPRMEEMNLGKVTTNARMATPCGQNRRNIKAEMLEIDAEIKKGSKEAGAI